MRSIAEYLAALRAALGDQLAGHEVDRVVEEVESHLETELAEATRRGDADLGKLLSAFGSPVEVARAYRRTGIRGLTPSPSRRSKSRQPLGPPRSHPSPRPQLMDYLNVTQIVRNLIRRPAFSLVTIATLGLGIGANAVILSVVNGVLLRPLPFPEADRLVRVYHTAPGLELGFDDIGLSFTSYFFFRDSGVLEDLAVFNVGAGNFSGGDEPYRVESISVSHSYFSTLGVPPALGRDFHEDDEAPGAPAVVILNHALWRGNFGGRADIVGETMLMDGESVEIIGVMPPDLLFPDSDPRLYETITLDRSLNQLGTLGIASLGRLRPGMTPDEAGAQLAARITDLTETFPDDPAAPILQQAGLTAHAVDLRDNLVGNVERTLQILMGSVGFILLIACANVANVFLVRAEGREREMAIRSAMGASRARLALGYLAESAVLGLAAGALGLLLAFGGLRLLRRWGPQQMPRIEEIGVDGTVLLATLVVSLFVGLLFGIIPCLRYTGGWLGAALKEGGRAHTAGKARFRLRSALVGAQVALALILLVGSGLMVRSFRSLAAVDPGFDADSVLTFQLALNRNDYPGEMPVADFIQRSLEAISEMPGVVSVGAAGSVPLNGNVSGRGTLVEDHPLLDGELPGVHFFLFTAPGYFDALRIPLRAGRAFERADHEQQRPAVVVNEAFADLYWPNDDPIGKRLQPGGTSAPNPDLWYSVVGVVGDVRHQTIEVEPVPMLYYPLTAILVEDDAGNRISPQWTERNPQFAVRTEGNAIAMLQPIRDRIWELDPNLPIARVQTMREVVDQRLAQRSFAMILLLVGAAGALLIGSVGIYGVISYVVSQRTREIGVRMALGARTEDIGRMVLGHSLMIAGLGILIGLGGAYFLTGLMDSLLFGVSPLDPATFAAVILTLIAVAAVAAYLPARRAAGVDPLEALQGE